MSDGCVMSGGGAQEVKEQNVIMSPGILLLVRERLISGSGSTVSTP